MPAQRLRNQCSDTPFIGKVMPPSGPWNDRTTMVIVGPYRNSDVEPEHEATGHRSCGSGLRSWCYSSLRMSTKRMSVAMIIRTTASSTTAFAAAIGNCKYADLDLDDLADRRDLLPAHDADGDESPMTTVMTKIEPMTMPGLRQRHDDVPQGLPAGSAGSPGRLRSGTLSMRNIELEIGTIMNTVLRWTKASTTEKLE